VFEKKYGVREMKYEYTVRIFSMEELKKENVVIDPQKNIVYACRPDGECEAHDMTEQLENLSELFNRMGDRGWELIELFFRPLGIVSYWKRSIRGKRLK
jgi:hypothetical protein